jgi:hypothetical protein
LFRRDLVFGVQVSVAFPWLSLADHAGRFAVDRHGANVDDSMEPQLVCHGKHIPRARNGDLFVSDGAMHDGIATVEGTSQLFGRENITGDNLRGSPDKANGTVPLSDAGANRNAG